MLLALLYSFDTQDNLLGGPHVEDPAEPKMLTL